MENLKHRAIAALLLIVFFNACGKDELGEDDKKKMLLTVGSASVTLGEFDSTLKRLLPENKDLAEGEIKELKRNLLNQIIEERLLLEEAKKRNITVTDEELTKEIKGIWSDYGTEEFNGIIAQRYGDMENWKNEMKKKVLVRKVMEKVIRPNISEKEIGEYYEKNRPDYDMPEQVRARMIVVKTKEDAERIRKRLLNEDFAAVATETSIGPEREQGGDLGLFGRGDMPPEFEDVVFSIPVGQISNVVNTPYGYHIFKVEERRKRRTVTLIDVKDNIREKLKRDKTEEEYRKWIGMLKKNTAIEINEELL